MIGPSPLAEYQAMSLEEMRCAILPQLFDLIQSDADGGHSEVWIWPNETMEIFVNSRQYSRFYLTRDGHVFTTSTKNFESPPESTVLKISSCGDYTACHKGCSCGCLISRGFYVQQDKIASDAEHCRK